MLDAGGKDLPGDRCTWLFGRKKADGTYEVWGWVTYHVDDFKYSASEKDFDALEKILLKYEMGEAELDNFVFCGVENATIFDTKGNVEMIEETQKEYIEQLEEIEVSTARRTEKDQPATKEELSSYRGLLGGILWACTVRTDASLETSLLSSAVAALKVAHLLQINELLARMKQTSEVGLRYRKLKTETHVVIGEGDANQDLKALKTHQGVSVLVCDALGDLEAYEKAWLFGNLVAWAARKSPRATTSTYSGETHAAGSSADVRRSTARSRGADAAGREDRNPIEESR